MKISGSSGTMVGLEGIEPTTFGLGNRCSILLSYRPRLGETPPIEVSRGRIIAEREIIGKMRIKIRVYSKCERIESPSMDEIFGRTATSQGIGNLGIWIPILG
jgi:hypothetical protein